ncbi:MAG: ACT domain-containing protein [Planctomycetota bacterium]
MAKRFLTADDVRRLGGPTIVVDRDTVVTPQALETAAAAGIAIRTDGGGAYSPPEPNRGPDAARAQERLPQLPEPESLDGVGLVVTAVGANRPGVLAQITGELARLGCDVRDISQRTVGDYFHMVLTCAVPDGSDFKSMKDALQCLGGEDDFVVRVMHERVFRFMHRV